MASPRAAPGFVGRVVVDALDASGDVFADEPDGTVARTARNADALWSSSLDSLIGGDGATIESAAPIVTMFVDGSEAAGTNGEAGVQVEAGPRVGAHTTEAILCDGVIDVTPLALGTPQPGDRAEAAPVCAGS